MTAPETGHPAPGRPRWLTALLVGVIAVGMLVAGGGLAVALGIGSEETPAADSVDAGFARDMSRHHLQAVQMANLALTRSEDPEVQQLAFDISATQTNQVGRMQGWLSLWGLPLTSGEVMGWMDDGEMADMAGMDHAGHGDGAAEDAALMPGMATDAELAELRAATGDELDVLFLQLMTRHHQGGLEMAEYGEEHAQRAAVQRLAESMAQSQTAETATMVDMLRDRGAEPLPFP
ncbi:DUF305 domain-containing protein [Modestobacter roseus]|uniref:Uncharacterized protein (DUF305 family) n=1 Tax=Modestobacter roseus TaxID=1181884 RepID=A0A562ISP3_9ACTN|nr:DUF305 domain-containing protein [Modestobacter roseus]MQA34849.1 DUF305 domain-containing protein [Modestobacter roseus]TWH74049.1 uncharacterized protein (DUF305 family) [Modestobacter roseus]